MRFYQNIDCDSTIMPYLNALAERETVNEADLYPFIDEFIETNVTDIMLNVNAQMSFSPSEIFDDYEDIYLRRTEDGHPVDYTDIMRGYYTVGKTFGLDFFGVWFRRIREVGMRAHLSVRMNDCHCPEEETCWLRPSYFYTARDKGLMNGDTYGYYRRTLNYKHLDVRQHFLDYVREQLFRYDVDGLELDFMREMVCFDYLFDDMDACTEIMNGFIREVKAIVREAEARYGHPIEITVRLARDLAQSLVYGFDAVAWSKEGLVDRIIPSPRFHGSDSHIPVGEWKRVLPNVEIIPCIEGLISTEWGMSSNDFARMTAETVRGHAARFLAEGADGVYTFNMFGQKGGANADDTRDKEVQCTLGDHATIVRHPLRFITVNEDIPSLLPEELPHFRLIPLYLQRGRVRVLTVTTGRLPADKQGRLILGFTKGTPEELTVRIGRKEVSGFVKIDTPAPFTAMAKGTVCYAAPVPTDEERYVISLCTVKEETVLSWIELEVK